MYDKIKFIQKLVSDTKIALNDELINLWNTEDERRLIRQVGLIKAIIVSPNIVVCYAGNNIDKAAELLREIKSGGNSLEQIIEIACRIHKNAKIDDIEFIIGYCDKNKRELISIKDRQIVRECKVAWIGSWDAYHEFKRMEDEISDEKIKGKKLIVYEGNGKTRTETLDEETVRISELEKIFSEIVESGVDSTVGGMSVGIGIPRGYKDLMIYPPSALLEEEDESYDRDDERA